MKISNKSKGAMAPVELAAATAAVTAAEGLLTDALVKGEFKPLANQFSVEHKMPLAVAADFVRISEELIKSVGRTGEIYLRLCLHIRKSEIAPRAVSSMLSQMGFHKVRISEINKVAGATDELWREYEARSLSFRNVLQLERGSPVLDAVEVPEAERKQAGLAGRAGDGEVEPQEPEDSSVKGRVMRLKDRKSLGDAAKRVLTLAARLKSRETRWNIGNGYSLCLSKSNETFAPVAGGETGVQHE